MAKYISSIRDLVGMSMTMKPEIESDAENNVPKACFQMGMIHLLGISSPIDFKKATVYFKKQSLASDPDTNRFLGFIAECEGNYSEAFKYYANVSNTTDKSNNKPLYKKIFDERNILQKFFEDSDLPTTLNEEVTAILKDYMKGGKSKIMASIKIATICKNESSCLEAAQLLYEVKDYYSAKRWLQSGNISKDNDLYKSLEEKISKGRKSFKLPKTPEVIDIKSSSFLMETYDAISLLDSKQICDEIAKLCVAEWKYIVSSKIKNLKKKEAYRIRKEKKQAAEDREFTIKMAIIGAIFILGFILGFIYLDGFFGGIIGVIGVLLLLVIAFIIYMDTKH